MSSWLTIDQAAQALQVHPRTVRRCIADGTIPVLQLGRSVRIDADALSQLVAKRS